MIVRQATTQDTTSIQALLRKTWSDTYGSYLSQATLDEVYKNWQSIEFLNRQIQNRDFYFPVATENDIVIGIATARTSEERTVMFRLYVDPDHQRKGVGQSLLQSVMEHFPQNKKIQLHVEAMNHKAQSFYKKQGFREIGREDEKVVNETIEQIIMEKELL